MTEHARTHALWGRTFAAHPSAILALLLALTAPTVAQQAQPALPAATVSKIEKAVTTFMAKANAPGVSVAIGMDGTLRFEAGYGLASLEQFVPATASTVYRLASVSR